jgi:hypothetical protein
MCIATHIGSSLPDLFTTSRSASHIDHCHFKVTILAPLQWAYQTLSSFRFPTFLYSSCMCSPLSVWNYGLRGEPHVWDHFPYSINSKLLCNEPVFVSVDFVHSSHKLWVCSHKKWKEEFWIPKMLSQVKLTNTSRKCSLHSSRHQSHIVVTYFKYSFEVLNFIMSPKCAITCSFFLFLSFGFQFTFSETTFKNKVLSTIIKLPS